VSERRPRASGQRDAAAEIVLYRCRTPTDVLCPCGTVARRLRKLDLPYRVERVAQRRAARPEVVDLTGQDRVPLLIDGEEVIHDSKRIVEYLQWRYGEDRDAAPADDEGAERPTGSA
jgi:hypothetical protein